MADLHDPNALDQLFKNSFEALPETSDPSGWDKPSARVWANVQSEIAPQNVSYGKYLWTGIGLAAVSILGFVLFSRNNKNVSVISTPKLETTVKAADPVIAAPPIEQTSKEIGKEATKAEKTAPNKKPSKTKVVKVLETNPTPSSSKPFIPNSSEREKHRAKEKAVGN
jgi:hypothetical protein